MKINLAKAQEVLAELGYEVVGLETVQPILLEAANEIDSLTAQLAEWQKVFGHLSKDADTAGNMINEGIAERDGEIEKLCNLIAVTTVQNEQWQQENAALREEVERLKEESSHLWVRIESGEAAAYEQGKAEARKQAAQEIIEEVIGEWNCDCGYGGLVIADAIKAKFGLEG